MLRGRRSFSWTTSSTPDALLGRPYGRPREIKLVVLVDRGHRELPIQADYVGKFVETADYEVVEVKTPPIDDHKAVYLTTVELVQEGK